MFWRKFSLILNPFGVSSWRCIIYLFSCVAVIVVISFTTKIHSFRVLLKIKWELDNSTIQHIRGAYNKFPDFFRMGTFIDSTHIISSGCNALVVPFQQLLEGPMEILLCERVNDLHHSLFHLLSCLITTASELRE